MSASISDIISFLALLLAAYATITTTRFNARQKFLVESQEKLNKIQLEKEEHESINNRMAEICATIVTMGKEKRIRICNQGKSAARNIRILFPEGNNLVMEEEVKEKFPLETLEKFANVELFVIQVCTTKLKNPITVQWDDDFENNREKTFHLTL